MSIFDGNLTIEVAAASGIEAVTKREIQKLGYEPSGANYGRIYFDGNHQDAMRANVFLRTANRVRIVLSKFAATTFDELFENISSMHWEDILTKDAKIIINAKSIKSKLFALSSVQSITKKAVIASLQRAYPGISFNETGSVYDIEISIIEDIATLTLDTTGDGLHKRGYRTYLGNAPIRETLAAAMIELSVWNPERPLIDPFCGSGTIPVEAAMIGLGIAPGMNRNFSMETFRNAPDVRKTVQEEAEALINRDRKLHISAFDIDKDAIALALKHAKKAGVIDNIHLQVNDMRNVSSSLPHGVIITNPPYGERMMTENEVKDLYRDFGKMVSKLNEWCVYTITSFRAFEKYFGKKADKTRKLYNSELECIFYQYLAAKPDKYRN
ncbi:MAG: class I SAM-dependent RNA methyltransferase [Clostridia bacterium]|nr:class I SAM-dependent RNA methyltransferase [Clostridia bacterium]